MKKTFLILLCALDLFAYNLTVIVTGLKNGNGEVQISLYNKEGSIPDKKLKKYYRTKRVKIDSKKVKTVFFNLPKGRYAVSVFHDENGNRKIDEGFFMPKEGVGVSNFQNVGLFHLPNFQRTSFLLDRDKEVYIKLIYF